MRNAAHEAGVEGASKMSTQDAEQAVGQVRSGKDPEQAKASAKSD